MNRPELYSEIRQALSAPTVKQREAYARFLHTLAAATVIGEATLIFAEGATTLIGAWRIMGLTISGVTCFMGGALLSRGE